MTELKKCPFCGGEAKEILILGRDGVSCVECGAMFRAEWEEEAKDVVNRWNNRATEAEIRAMAIDEFAEKLGRLCENSAMALDRYNGRPLYNKDGKWHDLITDVADQLKEE